MIRRSVIKKNINTSQIHHVIGHNGSVFFKIFFKYLIILLSSLLIFLLLKNYIQWEYLPWIFIWIGLILFTKFCIDFFNIYLDALVMTDAGVVLYLWEWLLEYRTETFDRDRIETISHNQDGIWDKMFLRWDITIRLEHGIEFPFENITKPKKQASKILQLKDRFLLNKDYQEDTVSDNKKFDVLVEALWEVVKDYIDKWERNKNDDFYEDYDYGWEEEY